MGEPATDDVDDELLVESREQLAEKLNPELLKACMSNDAATALSLLERGAEADCEDPRQWSPLIWAACHGNEELTRALIAKGAATMYKYDDTQGKVKRKKHSPIHWASFKGHLRVLWLLLGEKLDPKERDQLGNTALHQAGAGGDLEVVKCLLAQGVDVYAKNDRGHTPYVLCTEPEVQKILQKAMNTKSCKATGKQFSSTVMRYLCSVSMEFYCEEQVTQLFVYDTAQSEKNEKPVTWCNEVKATIAEAEHQLELCTSGHLKQLEAIVSALELAKDKPVDVKALAKCEEARAKLESEILLTQEIERERVATTPDEFQSNVESLSKAIDNAAAKGADTKKITDAKTLRRRLMAEASLTRALEQPAKSTDSHLRMLEDLTEAARQESANPELLKRAEELINRLASERDINHKLAEAAPLTELESIREAETRNNLPSWSAVTEEFEYFYESYKKIVEDAELHGVDQSMLAASIKQLETLENLLHEKKQLEWEATQKANKKKKGKKK